LILTQKGTVVIKTMPTKAAATTATKAMVVIVVCLYIYIFPQSALSHEEMQRSLQKSRSQMGQKFEGNKWTMEKELSKNQERNAGKLRKGSIQRIRTKKSSLVYCECCINLTI